ncbi:hypothetical protein OEZ86_004508 [Tetradesmus obliquus]|nr:hypothetical protein OEZ86_004508 [Tetradesmus obliquus]
MAAESSVAIRGLLNLLLLSGEAVQTNRQALPCSWVINMSSGSADDTQQDVHKKRNLLRGEVALYLSATFPGCSSALQQQQQQPPVRIKPEEEAAAPAAPPPPPAAAAAVAAAAAFVSLLEPVRQQLQQLRSQQQFTAAHEEVAGKALEAAPQLHDKGGHLPQYTALLQPKLGDWTLPLLALLLFKLQVRNGKGGRQKEGNPLDKDPNLPSSKALRVLANRQAAARTKLRNKIPGQLAETEKQATQLGLEPQQLVQLADKLFDLMKQLLR